MRDRRSPSAEAGAHKTLVSALKQRSLVLAGVIGVGVMVTACLAYSLLVVLGPRVEEHTLLAQTLRERHEGMLAQDSGLTGFTATGQRRFLQRYEVGVARVEAANERLRPLLIGHDEDMVGALLELRLAQQAWLDRWAALATESHARQDATELAAFLDSGDELFDTYLARYGEALTVAIGERQEAFDMERTAIGAGLIGQGLLLAAGYVVIGRQRRYVTQQIVQPIDHLVVTMEAVEHGDLDVRPQPRGPWELRQVAAGLSAMTESLQRNEEELRGRERQAAALADQLALVLEVARDVAGSLNVRYVCESVSAAAERVGGCDGVVVWLIDDDGVLVAVHDSRLPRHAVPELAPLDLGTGLVGEAARTARPASRDDDEHAMPLVMGGRVVGVLQLFGPLRGTGTESVALETLAIHAGAALEAARLHQDAHELSQIDALTRLANRRRLEADLEAECQRANRYGRPLGFLMLDLDHFKDLNDRFGHQVGDEALSTLAATLTPLVRSSDTVYRFGGEEFAVLVREGSYEDTVTLADRLCATIRERVRAPDGQPVTASVGVATLPFDAQTPTELVAAADRALYMAKAQGRDRVVSRAALSMPEISAGSDPTVS